MKKFILLTISILTLAQAIGQNSEAALNRKYAHEVRNNLEQSVAQQQKQMQKAAQQWLVSLPNAEKLSNETYISIDCRLADAVDEDGREEINFVFDISYNSNELVSMLDDYPIGGYQWNLSNSARAVCELTKTFIDGDLASLFRSGNKVDVEITSKADTIEIVKPLAYGGEYGDFRYMPVKVLSRADTSADAIGEKEMRISVSQRDGITSNPELAYIRAQSVRAMLDSASSSLARTDNNYLFAVRTQASFRRSAIRITVHNPFASYIEAEIDRMRQDEHVDYNIPVSEVRAGKHENTFVLVIANEHYDNAFMPDADYAANDGEIVRQYFVKTLGVPERQVKVLNNAARHTIMEEGVHWLTDLVRAVSPLDEGGKNVVPTATLFVYYTGYGFLDYSETPYIIPNNLNVDEIKSLQASKAKKGCKLFGKKKATPAKEVPTYDVVLSRKEASRFASQCVGVMELCALLDTKALPLKRLTVVLDAGFDGHQRNGGLMVRSDIKPSDDKRKRRNNLRTNVVILQAADYTKTVYSFDDQRHGFLTYFLLRELRKNARFIDNLNYQAIFEAVERDMSKESALQNKLQEPVGVAGGNFKEEWRNFGL